MHTLYVLVQTTVATRHIFTNKIHPKKAPNLTFNPDSASCGITGVKLPKKPENK